MEVITVTNTIRICSIDGCGRKHLARGFCSSHYQRKLKAGELEVLEKHYPSPEDSFNARTRQVGSCLEWTGRRDSSGYGYIWVGGNELSVHRYVWSRHNGKIPIGMQIDHICHNTSCANIAHLRLATPSQNSAHQPGVRDGSLSGHRNVHWHKPRNKWRVVIKRHGIRHFFGYFDSITEAAVVAEKARQDLFGEFAGKG